MPFSLFLYHGTHAAFNEFSLENSAEGAIFLTNNKAHARKFGPRVLAVQLTVDSILEVDGSLLPVEHELEDIEALVHAGQQKQVDAVLIKNFRDVGTVSDTYLVFDPANCQIVQEV